MKSRRFRQVDWRQMPECTQCVTQASFKRMGRNQDCSLRQTCPPQLRNATKFAVVKKAELIQSGASRQQKEMTCCAIESGMGHGLAAISAAINSPFRCSLAINSPSRPLAMTNLPDSHTEGVDDVAVP
jgi:hypothetical protein